MTKLASDVILKSHHEFPCSVDYQEYPSVYNPSGVYIKIDIDHLVTVDNGIMGILMAMGAPSQEEKSEPQELSFTVWLGPWAFEPKPTEIHRFALKEESGNVVRLIEEVERVLVDKMERLRIKDKVWEENT